MHKSPMFFSLPARLSPPDPLRTGIRRSWIIFGLVCLVAVVASLAVSGEIGKRRAETSVAQQARIDASLNAALLRTVLEKYRALPFVLSRDKDLAATLAGGSAGERDQLNRKLETLSAGTQESVIYVIGPDGIAMSASNWREPTSFVGNDYRFRAYFQGALNDGRAEHFALGSVSKKPGLYISQRIDGEREGKKTPLGVVVVKVEFDAVEADWAASGTPSYVIDDRGIVLITSIPSWRFMTIGKIPNTRLVAIRESLQFGDAPLQPLPFDTDGSLDERAERVRIVMPGDTGKAERVRIVMPGDTGKTRFLEVGLPVAETPWQLQHLAPLGPTIDAGMREARLLAMLALLPVVAGAALLLRRRHATALRLDREERTRAELERRVEERTIDLSRARDRLQAEINDHRSTESRLQAVQQDLVQANRLSILGQVAAGVAHEINQPVATIRAFADNARTFIDRGQLTPAVDNLESIAALTERIGTITDDLKTFARKGRIAAAPTDIGNIIDGALMLLRSRFAGRMDRLDIARPSPDLKVMGNRIRLEQVLINLVQNALEAVAPKAADGRVAITVDEDGDSVTVTVSDNGPGIAATIRDNLFTPFNTSKESGLGLGLVIAKDIVEDYGGRIDVSSDSDGSRFAIHLKRA
ncbi:sensor histidine kinase [Pararhizobium antarcticum]|uniref:C4-dicarboxylate transport sensor protein n=1 Tax=Pararhizobium antarcticum TaxID=1798805 RepID=A0A657LW00_9HYPH|nr:ATP-binding protein [Pararhizobium antarcticum]OJF97539.1 ATPase [Rhizobium sp. 58]OJF98789.1 ATPase [Pararhizobium antarcticum]OJF98824.1 ATPase [Pararhizobium antarcticum]